MPTVEPSPSAATNLRRRLPLPAPFHDPTQFSQPATTCPEIEHPFDRTPDREARHYAPNQESSAARAFDALRPPIPKPDRSPPRSPAPPLGGRT